MTPQTNGMPDLKYSEETFRKMYEALIRVRPYLNPDSFGEASTLAMINEALALAEGKEV